MFRPISRRSLIAAIVVAAIFAVLAFVPELEAGRDLAVNAFSTVLLVVAMAAALALAPAAPGLALTAAWAGAVVQMSFGRAPSPTDVPIFVVLFATAAYGSRRVFWAGFASVFLGAAVIVGYLFAPVVTGGGLSLSTLTTAVAVLIAALFGLGLAWTIGALVRTGVRARENRRARQLAEADAAAEAERTRIARDMHDVVAHSLAVVIAQADGARYAAASDPTAATAALGTISSTARAALSDVRMLLTQLRHTQADGPQPTLADLEHLYSQVRAAGAVLRVDVDPAPAAEVPASIQLAVYRIVQEALTNALRHGTGEPVEVTLAWHDDRVDLIVANAVAPNPAASASTTPGAEPGSGHGLIGMRERAQLVGGTLDAGRDGDRFVVRARLPRGGAL